MSKNLNLDNINIQSTPFKPPAFRRQSAFVIISNKLKSKFTIFIFLLLMISGIVGFSYYEKKNISDKKNIDIILLILINSLLILSGLGLTVLGNYITNRITLEKIDHKVHEQVNNLNKVVKEKKDLLTSQLNITKK